MKLKVEPCPDCQCWPDSLDEAEALISGKWWCICGERLAIDEDTGRQIVIENDETTGT